MNKTQVAADWQQLNTIRIINFRSQGKHILIITFDCSTKSDQAMV